MTILDNERGYAKPVAEVARAIYEDRNGRGCVPWGRYRFKQPYIKDATAALAKLRDLGFINDIGLAAIKAEQTPAKMVKSE